jgi:hypothetical protein
MKTKNWPGWTGNRKPKDKGKDKVVFSAFGSTYKFELKSGVLYLEVTCQSPGVLKGARKPVKALEWQPGVLYAKPDDTRVYLHSCDVLAEIRALAVRAKVLHQIPENAADIIFRADNTVIDGDGNKLVLSLQRDMLLAEASDGSSEKITQMKYENSVVCIQVNGSNWRFRVPSTNSDFLIHMRSLADAARVTHQIPDPLSPGGISTSPYSSEFGDTVPLVTYIVTPDAKDALKMPMPGLPPSGVTSIGRPGDQPPAIAPMAQLGTAPEPETSSAPTQPLKPEPVKVEAKPVSPLDAFNQAAAAAKPDKAAALDAFSQAEIAAKCLEEANKGAAAAKAASNIKAANGTQKTPEKSAKKGRYQVPGFSSNGAKKVAQSATAPVPQKASVESDILSAVAKASSETMDAPQPSPRGRKDRDAPKPSPRAGYNAPKKGAEVPKAKAPVASTPGRFVSPKAASSKPESGKELSPSMLCGTWSFTSGESQGFLLFYPGGHCHMEFSDGWRVCNFQYKLRSEVSGNVIRGVVGSASDGGGDWIVNMDSAGFSGSGSLGESDFRMERQHQLLADARDFSVGKWDLWSPGDHEWMGNFTVFPDYGGAIEYASGAADDGFSFALDGFMISTRSTRALGEMVVEFAQDGTVGAATVGPSRFVVWRSVG